MKRRGFLLGLIAAPVGVVAGAARAAEPTQRYAVGEIGPEIFTLPGRATFSGGAGIGHDGTVRTYHGYGGSGGYSGGFATGITITMGSGGGRAGGI